MPETTIKQVGAIPFYLDAKKNIHFVLITPKYSDNYWIFPKGHIEKDLGLQKSALQEATEEAGLEGEIFDKFKDSYKYKKEETEYSVQMFLMKVTKVSKSWDEQNVRKRKCVMPKKASSLIKNKSLLKTFDKAVSFLEKKMATLNKK